jgi:hypothetical protein
VPALLTGKNPDPDRLPFFADHRQNVFTLLGGNHRLKVVEPITRLCPPELCPKKDEAGFVSRQRRLLSDVGVVYGHVLLPRDLSARLPSISSTWTDFRDNALHDLKNRDEEFRAFVASIEPASEPTLWFLHTLLPHHPWRYLPSGSEYARATLIPGLIGDRWGHDPVLAAQAHQRHLLQVGFVDRLLGELLARLRATGLYDPSVIVVTADHGVAFQAGQPVRGLESDHFVEAIYPEIMWIPLFVKRPGQTEGRTLDTNVETIDVLPTIAEVLGIEVPWKTDGRSALSTAGRSSDKTFFQNQVNPFSVSRGERAVIDAREGWSRLLERTVDSFLPASGPLRSWRVGPRPALVGRGLGDLEVGPASTARAAVDADEFDDVRPGREPLPALVTGHLEDAAGDEVLAFTLNGTVAAVAPAFTWGGREDAFAVVLPDELFRPGANRLEIHTVGRDDQLAPVTID